MRTLSTFSILFWVYTKRSKNNQAPIYARITINKKKLNISLKRRVETRLWNNQKQRINGTSEKARKINQYLDEVHAKLFQCYQELRSENKPITPQSIKLRYTGDDKIEQYTLRDIIEYHNASMFEKLHGNTSRLYLTSQKYILLFIKKKYKADDFALASLDYRFILDFESFLRNYSPRHYKKQIGNNAVMKHIQRLRRMVSLAYQLDWIDRDPFVKFKQKLTPTYRGFLTPEELKNIEELQTKSTRIKLVKDLFVFSCYTGISYIDVMQLTNESLVLGMDKTNWIMTQRQKTRNAVKIPLLSKASEIIERYRYDKRSMINGSLSQEYRIKK